MMYPCPACGFEVFDQVPGSYELSPVCDWEDDGVQLRFPLMRGGANPECLAEYQQKLLESLPLSLKETKGFNRDSQWRPLTAEDCRNTEGMPQSGREYFDSIDAEEARYYWRA